MKQISTAEFESQVLGSPEPVLVDFYTDTCPPCRAMAPVLEEIENESAGQLKVVKVNAAEETSLAASFRINAVPAFLLFNQGKCVGQTLGAKSKTSMNRRLEESVRGT